MKLILWKYCDIFNEIILGLGEELPLANFKKHTDFLWNILAIETIFFKINNEQWEEEASHEPTIPRLTTFYRFKKRIISLVSN